MSKFDPLGLLTVLTDGDLRLEPCAKITVTL